MDNVIDQKVLYDAYNSKGKVKRMDVVEMKQGISNSHDMLKEIILRLEKIEKNIEKIKNQEVKQDGDSN